MPTIEENKSLVEDILFEKLRSPLVTGIGIGVDSAGDAPEHPQILVFVEPVADCELEPIVSALAGAPGGPVRLLRTGRFQALSAADRGSCSLYAPYRYNLPPVAAGTYGTIVEAGAKQWIVGSNHVLAHNGRAPAGTPIVSPSTLDEQNFFTQIASLTGFVELQPAPWPLWSSQQKNDVDCAWAETTQRLSHGPQALSFFTGAVSTLPMVVKTGRTTGDTQSQLCIWACDVYIDTSFGTYFFQNLTGAFGRENPPGSPFAAKGDSGAPAFIQGSGEAVGLVTAGAYVRGFRGGNGYIILMCSLAAVLSAMAGKMSVPAASLRVFRR